jgi:hypothetical protein
MLVGMAAACGGDGSDEATTGGTAESATTTSTRPSTTTAPPTTTTTVPPAADGTDLAACADGTCEVQVAAGGPPIEISMDGSLGVDTLTLASITPEGLAADGVAGGGSVQLHVEVSPGATSYMNQVGVTLVSVVGDTAVVRLAPLG